jgi:hypothetical protein
MNVQPVWSVETAVRLGRLTLVFFRGDEARGSLVFEEDEEEEAATWTELVAKLNEPQPTIVKELERPSSSHE